MAQPVVIDTDILIDFGRDRRNTVHTRSVFGVKDEPADRYRFPV